MPRPPNSAEQLFPQSPSLDAHGRKDQFLFLIQRLIDEYAIVCNQGIADGRPCIAEGTSADDRLFDVKPLWQPGDAALPSDAPSPSRHGKTLHCMIVDHMTHLGVPGDLLNALQANLDTLHQKAEGSKLFDIFRGGHGAQSNSQDTEVVNAPADMGTFTVPCEAPDGGRLVPISEGEAEEHAATSLEHLSDAYVEKLRVQFDALDTDEDERITLDQCSTFLEQFTGQKEDHETLERALMALEGHHAGEHHRKSWIKVHSSKATPNGAPSTSEEPYIAFISFDQFLHLMGAAELGGDDDVKRVHHRLRQAFDKAHEVKNKLQVRADMDRDKHDRLALLLEVLPAPVILLNAIVLGLRDEVLVDHTVMWNLFDIFFLIFYSTEMAVKLYVFGAVVYWCGPDRYWNWFDVVCVLTSLIDNVLPLFMQESADIGGAMLMKMLRLLKLARLIKALHYPFFDELKFMIMGVVSGLRVLFWALVLLLVMVYLIAVVMTNFMSTDFEEFQTLPSTMFTIFRCFTDGCAAYNGTPLQETVRKEFGALFTLCYVLMIMIVTFGLFNLIQAVFIENVMTTGARRRQQRLGTNVTETRLRFEVMLARNILRTKTATGKKHHLLSHAEKKALTAQLDLDAAAAFHMLPADLAISRDMFNNWIRIPGTIDLFEDSDIDTSTAYELFDALDADLNGTLTPKEIVEGLMLMRGPITKCDMIAVRMKVRYITRMMEHLSGKAEHQKKYPTNDKDLAVSPNSKLHKWVA